MTFQGFLDYVAKNKDSLTIVISSIGGLIALATFIKAIFEYRLQGQQKRAELFEKYKTTLKTEERLVAITKLLEDDDPQLSDVPLIDRYFFLGFYEQIAIAVNSGLIRKTIAHYMLSYFAMQCWKSENFWVGINKESHYWHVFKDYVIQMKAIESENITPNFWNKIVSKIAFRNKYKY